MAMRLTEFPHAWKGLTTRVERLAAVLAFEIDAMEQRLANLPEVTPGTERQLMEAQLLGTLAELEAVSKAVDRALKVDDDRAKGDLEKFVEARPLG
jgi:hypothetical protein